MRMCLVALLLLVSSAAAEPPLAIRSATVETVAATGRLERATVVVRDGKIEAVGSDVAVPEEATVIDAAGGTVMPGIIDPYFEVAVAASADAGGTRTIVVRGQVVTLPAMPARGGAYTRVADNFYPYDAGFKSLPRVGLTRLNLVTAGTGQSAVVRVTPADPARMLDRADGVAFASVTNQSESLDQIRLRLEAAARAKSGGPTGLARAFGLGGAAGTQLWTDVHDGKAPLVVAVANPAAVVHVLKAVEPYKNIKLTLVGSGVTFAETVDSLKGRGVRVLIRPNLEHVPNTRDRFAPARFLHERGIDVAFTLTGRVAGDAGGLPDLLGGGAVTVNDHPAAQDCPLFPVAVLVKCGLPRQVALEALTKRPAAVLGLESSLGTIEPGRVANLLLFTGDPLDPSSKLRLTLTDGRTTHATQ